MIRTNGPGKRRPADDGESGIRDFWGKLRIDRDSGRVEAWLPLASHCLDVAVVFRCLVNLPTIRQRLKVAAGRSLSNTQCDRLAVIALLHDLGKANLGFQDKVFDKRRARAGHIRELAPLLAEDTLCGRLAESLEYGRIANWFDPPDSLTSLLLAAWSHHGDPLRFDSADQTGTYYEAKTAWWVPDGRRDPFLAIRNLMTAARTAFPAAFDGGAEPLPCGPGLQHRFAGLVMLADWLGSHTAFFPLDRPTDDTVGFSSRAAQRAITAVGLDVAPSQSDLAARRAGFEQRFGFAPRPLQSAIDGHPLDKPDSCLLIAEAETGSGKTEAALARFFHLFGSGEVDSLYFALPTRVAARELYGRVAKYIERIFPNPATRPAVLLAVPGYARVDNVAVGSILPSQETRWDDDDRQRWQERAWAAEHPKRFLAAIVAVGTIDQALLSSIQVRHAHMRSVCLDRSLLVVDEVHASDPYMRRLLKGLLEHHLGLGGHALLLSATLGSRARAEFTGTAEPGLTEACAAPYPALTGRDGLPRTVNGNIGATPAKTVQVELLPWMEQPKQVVPRIATALQAGARVLVVLNTVGRAIALQRAVEAEGGIDPGWLFQCEGVVSPHHGRYAPVDREALDGAVTARLGKDSPTGPLLLVGTQTLEQSLDIDADLLITDLCPMDVLLQRIGRLHRHKRQRPAGFDEACCLVMAPETAGFENLLDGTGKVLGTYKRHGLGSVYRDLRVMQLTRNLLAVKPILRLPEDNRWLVEMATHIDRLKSCTGQRWQRHMELLEGRQATEEQQANFAALADLYNQQFGEFVFKETTKNKAMTRLGEGMLRIPLDQPTRSPFGQTLTEITIPGHLAPAQLPEAPAVVLASDTAGITLRYGGLRYRYSRHGLERIDEPAH